MDGAGPERAEETLIVLKIRVHPLPVDGCVDLLRAPNPHRRRSDVRAVAWFHAGLLNHAPTYAPSSINKATPQVSTSGHGTHMVQTTSRQTIFGAHTI